VNLFKNEITLFKNNLIAFRMEKPIKLAGVWEHLPLAASPTRGEGATLLIITKETRFSTEPVLDKTQETANAPGSDTFALFPPTAMAPPHCDEAVSSVIDPDHRSAPRPRGELVIDKIADC
jgi:hypothetical protein